MRAAGVGRREALVEGVDDVLERGPELLARARAEVVVEEVRRIRIVSAPADQAQALEGSLGEAVDHRARLEEGRGGVDAEVLLQLLGDLGGDRRRVRVVATNGGAEVDRGGDALAVREAGVGEKLLGRGGIEGPGLVAGAGERDLARREVLGDGRALGEEVLDDLVAVDAHRDRLADADVIERLLGVVEAEEQRVQARARVELQAAVGLDRRDIRGARVVDAVDGAGLEVQQSGGRLVAPVELGRRRLGLVAPVVGVGGPDDPVALAPFLEDVAARCRSAGSGSCRPGRASSR